MVTAGRNLGYSGGANLGVARRTPPSSRCATPTCACARGTAAAVLARFDAEPDLAAVGPVVREPDGTLYPSARRVPTVGDAVGHGLVGLAEARQRVHAPLPRARCRPDEASRRRLGVGCSDLAPPRGARRASAAGTTATSCTSRTSTCAGASGGPDGGSPTSPAGEVTHVQGVSTARHPYRMIVEHHRSLLRFAAKRWHGWRRVLLVPAACYLGLRAGLAIVLRAVSRSGRGEPTG